LKLLRRAMLALAAMTGLGLSNAAGANEWKMGPLSEVEIIHEARELQDTDRREFICLALNIYHEARGEPRQGQKAVAHVVLNRRASAAFPNSICGVVWQRSQFSWTVRPVGSLVPRDKASWEQSQRAALRVINGEVADPTSGANHFHARSIKPGWASRARARLNIGAHVFLRL
jgi:N-acetylmuramoyl-L-alanine amidase